MHKDGFQEYGLGALIERLKRPNDLRRVVVSAGELDASHMQKLVEALQYPTCLLSTLDLTRVRISLATKGILFAFLEQRACANIFLCEVHIRGHSGVVDLEGPLLERNLILNAIWMGGDGVKGEMEVSHVIRYLCLPQDDRSSHQMLAGVYQLGDTSCYPQITGFGERFLSAVFNISSVQSTGCMSEIIKVIQPSDVLHRAFVRKIANYYANDPKLVLAMASMDKELMEDRVLLRMMYARISPIVSIPHFSELPSWPSFLSSLLDGLESTPRDFASFTGLLREISDKQKELGYQGRLAAFTSILLTAGDSSLEVRRPASTQSSDCSSESACAWIKCSIFSVAMCGIIAAVQYASDSSNAPQKLKDI